MGSQLEINKIRLLLEEQMITVKLNNVSALLRELGPAECSRWGGAESKEQSSNSHFRKPLPA